MTDRRTTETDLQAQLAGLHERRETVAGLLGRAAHNKDADAAARHGEQLDALDSQIAQINRQLYALNAAERMAAAVEQRQAERGKLQNAIMREHRKQQDGAAVVEALAAFSEPTAALQACEAASLKPSVKRVLGILTSETWAKLAEQYGADIGASRAREADLQAALAVLDSEERSEADTHAEMVGAAS